MAMVEESVHRAAIRELAESVNRPLAEVENIYEQLFMTMSASATITNYLPVLVARKIRECYRRAAQ
jgi:hypothetical protein